ncbi:MULTISPECIES: hypothetical protein [unclassified Deinococcus]|uniref:hypothetical protein n=1 Tax=unclassified Deinococcus TaxID=2623546 RepID=UPI001C3005D5|nr:MULTISPECIES: hypothetical protein [unclassified Deinococcus]MDK2013585.1 hypothetical protein [Deinococcus sp. 43]
MSLIRQLLSFLRAPERVALLFTDRGDGTSGPVGPGNPMPVTWTAGAHGGAASDPDSAREVTLREVRDLAGLIRDNTYLVAALANGAGLTVRAAAFVATGDLSVTVLNESVGIVPGPDVTFTHARVQALDGPVWYRVTGQPVSAQAGHYLAYGESVLLSAADVRAFTAITAMEGSRVFVTFLLDAPPLVTTAT